MCTAFGSSDVGAQMCFLEGLYGASEVCSEPHLVSACNVMRLSARMAQLWEDNADTFVLKIFLELSEKMCFIINA